MILGMMILGISLSIDSAFVGFSYGIKGTKIPNLSKLIICVFSVLYAGISLLAGHALMNFLPPEAAKVTGALILALIGLGMVVKALEKSPPPEAGSPTLPAKKRKGIYIFLIGQLEITIRILKDPDAGDLDKSGSIDAKESMLLGFALSVDALGAGVGSALLGIGRWYLPFIIGAFQLMFLCTGLFAGKCLKNRIHVSEKRLSVFSGAVLIAFSCLKLF